MDNIGNIPYTTAEFDADGKRLFAPRLPAGTRKLIVVSHGWNNNREAAESLYQRLFGKFAGLHPDPDGLAIVGVIWPSKQFDFGAREVPAGQPGAVRAAGLGAGAQGAASAIANAFDEIERVYEGSGKQEQLAALRALSADLGSADAQERFVKGLRGLLGAGSGDSSLDASDVFFRSSEPQVLFANAKQASADVGNEGGAGGMLGAAGLGDGLRGVPEAVNSLLNITSYYEMKKRAGTVGALGLAPLLDELETTAGLQAIYLVGHSFGARLVTAAAMASRTTKLHALVLLQAAFSHRGFSGRGYFYDVIKNERVDGPIVITHTANDQAVGKAYAIASRLAQDAASDLGDPNDKYGGLGRNGAVEMAQDQVSADARVLLAKGTPYVLRAGLIHNLEASAYIADHGAVDGAEVAWAISQAIGAGRRA